MRSRFQYKKKPSPTPGPAPKKKMKSARRQFVGKKGTYEEIRSLGEGSYGEVSKCRNIATGEMVAVKIFIEGEDDARVLFEEEYGAYRQLGEHPYILKILDTHKTGAKEVFLVTELMDGDAWRLSLDTLEKVREGVTQLLMALDFAHGKNVTHADIKPSNILVNNTFGKEFVMKLADFGLHCRDDEVPCTSLGSPGSRDPELVAKYERPGARAGLSGMTFDEGRAADVYALAMTIYWLLEWRAGHSGGTGEYSRDGMPSFFAIKAGDDEQLRNAFIHLMKRMTEPIATRPTAKQALEIIKAM